MLRRSKPVTPGSRGKVSIIRRGLYRGQPHKSLVSGAGHTGGRNNAGRMTVRHRGGGHRSRHRMVDFRRTKEDMNATVQRIEYDPGRSANLALLKYTDGEYRYVLALKGMEKNDVVSAGKVVPISNGNCLPLQRIPQGTTVCCVELKPGKGAQLARSAGSSAQFVAVEGDYAFLRLRSTEMRKVHVRCRAVIGEVGNAEHFLIKLGKAGAVRWRGRRPHVRGMVKNPVDHPMGGGEGRSKSNKIPCSPTGVPAKGYRTRRNKLTAPMIVSRRRNKRR